MIALEFSTRFDDDDVAGDDGSDFAATDDAMDEDEDTDDEMEDEDEE